MTTTRANWREQAERSMRNALAPLATSPAQRPDFRVEAEMLLLTVLGCDRSSLYAWPDTPVEPAQLATLAALLHRRVSGEPLAYIIGTAEFYGRSFQVGPDVLIPRDDTDVLVELGLQCLRSGLRTGDPRVLDLGTGSGAVAITLAAESGSRVVASDISMPALRVAADNARRLTPGQVEFVEADWLSAFASDSMHMILGNPPYIANHDPHLDHLSFEPRSALVSGPRGLDAIERIIAEAIRVGVAGCPLILEHGHDQGQAVRERMQHAGLVNVHSVCDLAGHERVTLGDITRSA